ncbi:type II toxin-antitoxin system HicB family antitoxin [Methylosarcina fibrata]|uniref:type II toxin-antitoxin system HicB family antitoxin n=1 Tax=Methylosarcina fibrata TaxID=105972 RepID=UPI000A06C8B3|nr:type II toxin-antitoxin system HicB family antitoxin [Methylosarcina fibrata]
MEEHQANPEYRDGIWGIVELDMSQLSSKSKRVNITLPKYLLRISLQITSPFEKGGSRGIY